jgi:serine/threonine-protein kinase RsbW
MEWRFPSRLDELSRVGMEVIRFLESNGIGGRSAYAANLALEELGTNILKYGYDDDKVHEILLQIQIRPDALQLVLEDDGHPFNPLVYSEPTLDLPAEERLPGGLGIYLVRKMADRVEYQRCAGRNRVTVEIQLSAVDPDAQKENS